MVQAGAGVSRKVPVLIRPWWLNLMMAGDVDNFWGQ